MTRPSTEIPDAVTAVVQAVLDSHPGCDPGRRGHLIVRELRALGWRIEAPVEGAASQLKPPPP
ncbi:hypothetical protein A6A07_11085 [Streptomyces sp. CB03911]|nr:hypothetical protein A6A07_11085 [Streptomyces sp. CB03911]